MCIPGYDLRDDWGISDPVRRESSLWPAGDRSSVKAAGSSPVSSLQGEAVYWAEQIYLYPFYSLSVQKKKQNIIYTDKVL